MKKYLILLTLFVISLSGWSQQIQQSSLIKVKNIKPTETPIRISDINVDVKVVGPLAVTTVDMTFYNPNRRIIEGELNFPLADGQSISRFALDINGKLREGVVVEKARGQQVFESIVRQGVDPGLLEKTQGNNFRTRVYPLPAKGSRRVVIAYEQELDRTDKGYRFFLPVEYGENIDNFSLSLTVMGNQQKPEVEETPWGKFGFDKSGDAYVASYSKKNFGAKGQLVFNVPVKNKQTTFVEKGKISGNTYFYTQIYPQGKTLLKQHPKRIALYWDISGSMINESKSLDYNLLDKYFAEIRDVIVELHTFNIILNKPYTFKIENGDWSSLRSALENAPYDGATQMGKINFAKSKTDDILLFSDGLSNFGKQIPQFGTTAINVINSSLTADHSMLKYIAVNSGGKYINLQQQSPDEGAKALMYENFHLLSAEYNRNHISDLALTIGKINTTSGYSVAGKLTTEESTIKLNFGTDSQVLYTETITVSQKDMADYDNIIERVWAEKMINKLDLLYEYNKNKIEKLGRQYNIVSRNTSLIVLEQVNDYIKNEITPPDDLLPEYNRIMASKKAEKYKYKESRIEEVLPMLTNRIEWWKKSFPKDKPIPPIHRKRVHEVQEQTYIPEERELRIANDMAVIVEDVQGSEGVEGIDISERQTNRVILEESAPDVIQTESSTNKNNIDESKYKQDKATRKNSAQIKLNNWSPDTPYLSQLKNIPDRDLYNTYLTIRSDYKETPSFFLDVANLFDEKGLKEKALIVLSNLTELNVENYRLKRVLGYRLLQLGYTDYAIQQFESVAKLRPEEPQSFRDLGLAYVQNKDYQKAIETLNTIIEKSWDARFPYIELFAIEEINAAIKKAQREKIKLDLSVINNKLIYSMPVDIRIVMSWDTDNTDIDMWVIDPYGEACYYGNNLTRIGGMISNDFTGGYGPEEFLIRDAVKGRYKIKAHYYGNRQQTLVGPTTIYLDIYTHYLSGEEKKETITLRLSDNKETIDVGEITFE